MGNERDALHSSTGGVMRTTVVVSSLIHHCTHTPSLGARGLGQRVPLNRFATPMALRQRVMWSGNRARWCVILLGSRCLPCSRVKLRRDIRRWGARESCM
jgi:hypothetical protein